jgi:hypothetical protein
MVHRLYPPVEALKPQIEKPATPKVPSGLNPVSSTNIRAGRRLIGGVKSPRNNGVADRQLATEEGDRRGLAPAARFRTGQ